jgi:thiol-disulfide isomerase/thioredoxin
MNPRILCLLFLLLLGTSYSVIGQSSIGKQVEIKGLVNGLPDGQKIILEHAISSLAKETICSTRTDANGRFELKGIVCSDIYTLRLANRAVPIILIGGEKIELTATMEDHNLTAYNIKGSPYDTEMKEWKQKLNGDLIAEYLRNASVPKPLLHLYLVYKLRTSTHSDLYKKVLNELKKAYPRSHHVKQLKKAIKTAKKNPKEIAIGQKAPNVRLPNPNGKKMTLSKLKGKVVLIDFWASWCRPCRMENPHIVNLYNAYKDKKFDIFSISLDGLDARQEARFGLNKKSMENQRAQTKKKWIKAIKDDGLIWKNHVSELKSWTSEVASLYNIKSIPATYILDKKGVIRYKNLKGQALEKAIQELLAE